MVTANKVTLVSNRVEKAKALLLSQFQDSPNINGLLTVLIKELQELENTLNDLQTVRTLDGSYGAWLDYIGEELKVDRNGYTDSDYKTAIKIAMFKRTASATTEDIQRIVGLLAGDSEAAITNNYPYMMELTSYLFCVGDSQEGLELLAQLFPANTAIKINKRFGRSWGFKTGNGFGSGATLNSLVYHNYGIIEDARFTSSTQAVIPPTLPVAPSNVTTPVATGLGEEGQTLACSQGSWVGDAPITYTYQWTRNGVDISGETNTTYLVTGSDLDTNIACVVKATNSAGFASVQSNSITISAVSPPVSTFTSDLGLFSVYGTADLVSDGDVNVAFANVAINSDGTTGLSASPSYVQNLAWLTTTGAGLGSDYTISYVVVSGDAPTGGILPNTTYNLGTNRFIDLTLDGSNSGLITGTYTFTFRNITDPSISQTRTISLSAELIDTYN